LRNGGFAAAGSLKAVRGRLRAQVAGRILFPVAAGILFLAPGSVRADYTAVVNPGSVLAANFQGWGSSLCWWANVTGGYSNRTNFVDLAFSQLKLNIVRYNIGGGQNPAVTDPSQGYRTKMQGFEPTNGVWNWNADLNQRWVLQAALARGANLVDAFANSPPWWMCVSSNVDGANPATNNLQVNCETNFAVYLATVVSNLTVLDGVHFNYLTPMNEPNGSKWDYTNESQEGCDMNPSQQGRVVNDLYAQLKTNAPSVGIDAAEDVDPYQTYNDLINYSSTQLGDVALFTTHTYGSTGASDLQSEAAAQKKPLWVAESGDSDGTGMEMARRIHDDITVMGARAWVYWQVVDSASGWGLLLNSLAAPGSSGFTTNYTINEKFYVMGQFSEFIRPGYEIISVNDTNTLAAYNPTNASLVLIMVNSTGSSLNVTYNLGSFGALLWKGSATQTAPGENMTALSPPMVTNQQFTAAISANSVTTFVLTTNGTPPVITSQLPMTYTNVLLFAGEALVFSVSATGDFPLYYQWFSNNVALAWATNTIYAPTNLPLNAPIAYDCLVSNRVGTVTSMAWPVLVVPAPTASYPRAVLALGPLGYWRLNEAEQGGGDNGVIARDYAGGNNGIYTNVLLGQPGYSTLTDPTEPSAQFGQVAAQSSCAYGILSPDFSLPGGSNAEFTVEAWANSTGVNGLSTPTIAAKGYYNQEEYALDAGAPNSSFRFLVRNAAGTAYTVNSMVSLTNSGQWYHLVGVCDEVHGFVMFYINGALAASSVAIPVASGIMNSSPTPMTIGSRSSYPTNGFDQQFPGYISDVAVYNYALNKSQIKALYEAGVSLPSAGLTLQQMGANEMQLNWNYGVLQSATNVAGTYNDLTNAVQPYLIPATNAPRFYRVREN
jgi:O-glycosyl hydrolase